MNVKMCVMCGNEELNQVDIDYPIDSSPIKSLKVPAIKCCKCGEEYIEGREFKAIEQIIKALKEQAVGA